MAVVEPARQVSPEQVHRLKVPVRYRRRDLEIEYAPRDVPEHERLVDSQGREIRAYRALIDRTGLATIEYDDGTGHEIEIEWV